MTSTRPPSPPTVLARATAAGVLALAALAGPTAATADAHPEWPAPHAELSCDGVTGRVHYAVGGSGYRPGSRIEVAVDFSYTRHFTDRADGAARHDGVRTVTVDRAGRWWEHGRFAGLDRPAAPEPGLVSAVYRVRATVTDAGPGIGRQTATARCSIRYPRR